MTTPPFATVSDEIQALRAKAAKLDAAIARIKRKHPYTLYGVDKLENMRSDCLKCIAILRGYRTVNNQRITI